MCAPKPLLVHVNNTDVRKNILILTLIISSLKPAIEIAGIIIIIIINYI